ncbi:MAG: hypothetical protein ABI212_14740 [Burkholderiaceae bacterium]
MTPQEIAQRFPRLYHVTRPGAMQSIERYGLLSTRAALERFGMAASDVEQLTRHRRPASVLIEHAEQGVITINDNIPLSEAALAKCLDDPLTPGDWLHLLNGRVFFWADDRRLERLLSARAAHGQPREVLVFDAERLAQAHLDTLAFSAINSGATIRKPARRGLSTFTRVADRSFDEWRRLRGRLDNVLEITVDWAVPRAAEFVVDVRPVTRP